MADEIQEELRLLLQAGELLADDLGAEVELAWEVGMMKMTGWPTCSLICFTWSSKAFSQTVLRF